ncbi:hypothetical protein OG792_32705 [Micromonospora sp. NBC_01699]|uniref:DUF6879 family protein n=1 Tax=Micromonospora sp. NBC_01699 TaxID=2975984 RepID=UPI002E2E2E82|nr:DUF6879 family protein [Micromonospora sp. NBC_01699]
MTTSETARLLASATRSACHLELRDVYTPDDPDWLAWQAGDRFNPAERWHEWHGLIKETTARGVLIRRARIVSEPVTDYVVFEYDVTEAHNIAAGESVRWLSRSQASDLLVPPADFWVIDDTVVFNHFDGFGNWGGEEVRDDPDLARRLVEAFNAVWERAMPHDAYRPPTS